MQKTYMAENLTEPFLIRLKEAIDADPSLNVSNLSVKAGLSNSTIRFMLRDNKSPRITTMRKICAALGTTLEDFMSGQFDGSAPPADPETQRIHDLLSQLSPRELRLLLSYGEGLRDARQDEEE